MSDAKKPQITLDEVHHVARLAHIAIDDDEAARLQHDLQDILDYVDTLNRLDTTDVAPTAHGVPLPTRMRPDTVGDTLGQEHALDQAPDPVAGGFGVPKVLE